MATPAVRVKGEPGLSCSRDAAYLCAVNRSRRAELASLLLLLSLLVPARALAQRADVTARAIASQSGSARSMELEVTFTFSPELHQTLDKEFFFVRLDDDPARLPAGFSTGATRYPEGTAKQGTTWFSSPAILRLSLEVSADVAAGSYTLPLLAGYQLCRDDGLCYLPQRQKLDLDVTLADAPPAAGSSPGLLAALRVLLLAFVGGLLLNVMPCVLPVLSIKALSLVKQAGADRRRILSASLAYAAGIVLSLVALAAVVVAIKATGERVGWGFQFQNPAYVVALLAIIFVFALSLFGVFTIQLPVGSLAARAGKAEGLGGSLLAGVMAVLLATPCTAPFLGSALGYAFSQAPPMIFLMFGVVGLGLASPFVLLGAWPGVVRRIPRPGPWTEVFRAVMGFLLIGTALFLLDVLQRQLGGEATVRVLVFLGLLAAAVWVYGRFGGPARPRWQRWASLFAALAIGVVGGMVSLRLGPPDAAERGGELAQSSVSSIPAGWEGFSPALVDGYRGRGEPVFLAFGASWCWSCRINEATVLSRREVREAFAASGAHLIYGDYTDADDTITAWLARFERAGVPLYVYFPPRGEPRVLPELLTQRMVIDALR